MLVSVLQVYAFLLIAWLWGVEPPLIGYLTVLPALILAGLMLGSLGLLISSAIRQLENFAGVMNFVIFPMFFASTALYPLWRMRDSSVLLHDICALNPFSHAVELIRFALYGQFNPLAFAVVVGCIARLLRRHHLHVRSGQGPLARPAREEPNDPRAAARPSRRRPSPLRPSPPGRPTPTGPASSAASRAVAGAGLGRAAARRGDEALAEAAEVQDAGADASRCAARRWRRPRRGSPASPRRTTPAALTALFVATLDHVNPARDRVMAGITRYAHKQEALDGRDRGRPARVRGGRTPPSRKDFDRIDALEEELDWSTRIFQDRQQSLTYVCETPVILEQRAFALARVDRGARCRNRHGQRHEAAQGKSRSHSGALATNILRSDARDRNPVDDGEEFRGTTFRQAGGERRGARAGRTTRSATC